MGDQYFGQNLTFQSAVVTLKIRSRSQQILPTLFPFPIMYLQYASLVKIHPLLKEIGCRKMLIFKSLYAGDLENYAKDTKI